MYVGRYALLSCVYHTCSAYLYLSVIIKSFLYAFAWCLEWLVNNIVDFLGTDVAHSIYAIFGTYLILISAGNFSFYYA